MNAESLLEKEDKLSEHIRLFCVVDAKASINTQVVVYYVLVGEGIVSLAGTAYTRFS
jgi:hypothetical protein